MKRITLPLFIAVTFAVWAQAAPIPVPTITLLPAGGDVAGNPGSVVGWGFTFTYNTSGAQYWAVLDSSQFTGSPVYGNYTDYLATGPLYVAGPAPESPTVSQPWNQSASLGVGEFDLYATDPSGVTVAGDIIVHYSVYSQDPNDPAFGSTFDPTVIADATLSSPVVVTVSPEPTSLLLMSAGLLLFAFRGVRRRKACHGF